MSIQQNSAIKKIDVPVKAVRTRFVAAARPHETCAFVVLLVGDPTIDTTTREHASAGRTCVENLGHDSPTVESMKSAGKMSIFVWYPHVT